MRTAPVETRSGTTRWLALVAFGAACFAAAAVGALGVSGQTSEYQSLDTPSWAPPQEVFGPVWTVLYVLIAVAGWLAWTKAGWGPAMWAYAAQLVLNAAWTPLFFGAGEYGLAFADIVVLWIAIAVTVALFWRVSRTAAWLMVPYWLWTTYAAALNLAVWTMN